MGFFVLRLIFEFCLTCLESMLSFFYVFFLMNFELIEIDRFLKIMDLF